MGSLGVRSASRTGRLYSPKSEGVRFPQALSLFVCIKRKEVYLRYVFSLIVLGALLSWGFSGEVSPPSDELISAEGVSDSHPGEMTVSEKVAVLEQSQTGLEVQEEIALFASCLSSASREASNSWYKKVDARNAAYTTQHTEDGIGVGWTWYGPAHQFFMA